MLCVSGLEFGLGGQHLDKSLDDLETEGRHPTPIFVPTVDHLIRLFERTLIGFTPKIAFTKARRCSARSAERGDMFPEGRTARILKIPVRADHIPEFFTLM
jgi:hypothetical protein